MKIAFQAKQELEGPVGGNDEGGGGGGNQGGDHSKSLMQVSNLSITRGPSWKMM